MTMTVTIRGIAVPGRVEEAEGSQSWVSQTSGASIGHQFGLRADAYEIDPQSVVPGTLCKAFVYTRRVIAIYTDGQRDPTRIFASATEIS